MLVLLGLKTLAKLSIFPTVHNLSYALLRDNKPKFDKVDAWLT